MTVLFGLYLFGLAGAIASGMLLQYVRGTHDLLSVRNVFLTGFIIFQCVSGALPLITGNTGLFRIQDMGSAGLEYTVLTTAFLLIFLLSYHSGVGVRRIAHKLASSPRSTPGSGFLLTMSAVFVLAGAVLRFAIAIPLIGILADIVGVGFASMAAGLMGWVWGKRLLNPALITWGTVIVAAAAAVAVSGEFGRRNLVSIGGGLAWGMYYASWRYKAPSATLRRLAIISAPMVVVAALFTSVRGSFNTENGVSGQVSALARGNVSEGLSALAEGQATGEAAMWVIENYPESRPYEHLFSLKYFFMIPVPRAWWPDKPEPISTKLAKQANVRGVNQGGVTLPPGVIGNSASEGGLYALIIYAVISGLFMRFFDEVARSNIGHPLVVLVVGTQLGQILGFPRGEPSNFANIYALNFIGVWLSAFTIAKLLDAFGVKRAMDVGFDALGDDSSETFDDDGDMGEAQDM